MNWIVSEMKTTYIDIVDGLNISTNIEEFSNKYTEAICKGAASTQSKQPFAMKPFLLLNALGSMFINLLAMNKLHFVGYFPPQAVDSVVIYAHFFLNIRT